MDNFVIVLVMNYDSTEPEKDLFDTGMCNWGGGAKGDLV